jgi:PAS domain S-box-containing protein/putative nucleotidyltransferase with HDIG domain
MNIPKILYLLPYFGSLGLSLGILFFALRRRGAPGTSAYIWYASAQSLWIFGFIVELILPTLQLKMFWDGAQWLAAVIVLVSFPVFAVQYTEHKLRYPRMYFAFSLIVPVIFTALLITDPFHHLIYPDPQLIPTSIFPELSYKFSTVVIGFAIYSYAVTVWGIGVVAARYFRPHNLYRAQIVTITIGFLIPIIGTALSLLNIHLIAQRDSMPLTTAIGNAIVAWGIYRFRIFEVIPIGRDKVFEAMVDPVVIVDNQNNILDINSSMLVLLGKTSSEVIGKKVKDIFDEFPIPIKLYAYVSYARAEAMFQIAGKDVFYELTVWPLYNNKKISGRIYISHDITAMKELEQELRDLNAKLENRVRARTHELAEAYDTTLEGWARALELRDEETEGHSRRVTETTLKIARAIELPQEDLEHIRRGAILHDIGKMSVPDEILHKPGKLTAEERIIVQKHPVTAYELLSPIPFLKKALEVPYSHHEKWDGTGYPQGLKGRDIPLSARIFAVADVWDAIRSARPYNSAWPRDKAITYLIEQSGTHFDPRIVNIFLDLVEKGEI